MKGNRQHSFFPFQLCPALATGPWHSKGPIVRGHMTLAFEFSHCNCTLISETNICMGICNDIAIYFIHMALKKFILCPDLISKNDRDTRSDLLGDQLQHGMKEGALFSNYSN